MPHTALAPQRRQLQTLGPQRSQILADFLSEQPKPSGVTPFAGAADLGTNLINTFFKGQGLRQEQSAETARRQELAKALGPQTVEGPLPAGGVGPGAPTQQPATLQSALAALLTSGDPQLQQLGATQQLAQFGRQQEQQATLGAETRAEQRQIGAETRAEQAQIRKEERQPAEPQPGFTLGNVRFDAVGNEIARVEPEAAKPPAGFRAVGEADALEPIPGGPADIAAQKVTREQEVVEEKQKLNREGQTLKATNSIRAAERAFAFLQEKKRFLDPTGFKGQIGRFIGGTDANQLDKLIEPIRANLGFDELQKMRAASPTGGALGQVAVRELELLQATLVNLDISQKTPFLEQALTDVQTHFNNWLSAVNQAEEEGDVGSMTDEQLRAIAAGGG